MSPMNQRLMRPKNAGPVYTPVAYTRLWCVTTKASGNITVTATVDSGWYAVRWWDQTVTTHASGDTATKAVGAYTGPRLFEVVPTGDGTYAPGDESGNFLSADVSDNGLTAVRANNVAPMGIGATNGYPHYSYFYTPGSLRVAYNSLSSSALNAFYTDLLAAVNSQGYLFVTGNPGVDADTPTIASNKGYTVFGSVPAVTQLLLNFDGSNGSTTATDASPQSRAITFENTAQLSTSSPKYGTAALNGGYVLAGGNWAGTLGSGDWTVECWFRVNQTTTPSGLWGFRQLDADAYGVIMFCNPGGEIVWFAAGTGNVWAVVAHIPGLTAQANQWHHLALVRQGEQIHTYLDGVAGAPANISGSIQTINVPLVIGESADADNFTQEYGSGLLDGKIDDFRVITGYAMYRSNFTPPTAPLTVFP